MIAAKAIPATQRFYVALLAERDGEELLRAAGLIE
jgi:hypothetical protein